MLGVLANYHDLAFSFDDLALLADLLYGWFHLHCLYHTFLALIWVQPSLCVGLFCSPSDASLGQVINRNLNGDAISGQDLDIIHTKLP